MHGRRESGESTGQTPQTLPCSMELGASFGDDRIALKNA